MTHDGAAGPPSSELVPETTRPLADAQARRTIRDDLDATLVVEAAAGTGKTTELVARMLAVLRSGRGELAGFVAVTFTEKAAGEMKLRLRDAIERARTGRAATETERARLDAALAQLEVARIGTIHSLCADLLRERPVEARVDPLFSVVSEDEARRLFDEAFERWFSVELSAPGEGLRRMLRRRARGRGAEGPRSRVRTAAYRLAGQRDFDGPWRREPLDRAGAIDAVLGRLATLPPLARLASRPDDVLARLFDKVGRWIEETRRIEDVRGRDYDGLEAELCAMTSWWEWKANRGGKLYGKSLARVDVQRDRDAVLAELTALTSRLDADLAACLFVELAPVVAEYERLKTKAGVLDFLDLLLKTRDLLVSGRDVRQALARRYTHLFVDEFQDTDPLQAEILLLLASDDAAESDPTRVRPVPGKLFIVGDPKQSIYRFRRADVAFYEATKRRLLSVGARLVYLTTSFRGAPTIQKLVNAAFEPCMRGGVEGGQAEYVALSPFRDDPTDRPSVVALPVPRPYGDWGTVTKDAIARSTPDAVGAFVDFLVRQSGWTIREPGKSAPVPIQARHVCLLFRRFQSFGDDLTRPYVRALEVRRVPHVLVGGRSYHDREEVLALRNALTAVEWPDDELAVYATLRGPLFSIGDDVLLAVKDQLRSLHPLRAPAEGDPATEAVAEVRSALDVLARLHVGRNRRPIADTVARLLEATRAHANFAIWPTGEQALANVLRVMDLARRFEGWGATSFRAFVEFLEDEAEAGQAADAPVVEEGTEGVRMMTVHRAKGLEFPVVILVDPNAPLAPRSPSRHVDPAKRLWVEPLSGLVPVELAEHATEVLERDAEESIRLTYVAATRARDLLVVPVVADRGTARGDALEGWLSVLYPALYPPVKRQRAARPAPGCPPFGADGVLDWPARVLRDASWSVAPGLHTPEAGDHPVVWWDPAALGLDAEGAVGLRQQRILAADEGGVASDASTDAHAAWQARRAAALASGSAPSLRVRSVSEVAMESAPSTPVPVESTTDDRTARPHGRRFGTLVHAVLAEVDLGAGADDVQRAAALAGRLLGAPDDEIAAAMRATRAALAHPLLRRATAAERCRRECPMQTVLDDGTLVEGVVDLAFREVDGGARWTVVDFKTDVELGRLRDKYDAQLTLYARALEQATGERASPVILSV